MGVVTVPDHKRRQRVERDDFVAGVSVDRLGNQRLVPTWAATGVGPELHDGLVANELGMDAARHLHRLPRVLLEFGQVVQTQAAKVADRRDVFREHDRDSVQRSVRPIRSAVGIEQEMVVRGVGRVLQHLERRHELETGDPHRTLLVAAPPQAFVHLVDVRLGQVQTTDGQRRRGTVDGRDLDHRRAAPNAVVFAIRTVTVQDFDDAVRFEFGPETGFDVLGDQSCVVLQQHVTGNISAVQSGHVDGVLGVLGRATVVAERLELPTDLETTGYALSVVLVNAVFLGHLHGGRGSAGGFERSRWDLRVRLEHVRGKFDGHEHGTGQVTGHRHFATVGRQVLEPMLLSVAHAAQVLDPVILDAGGVSFVDHPTKIDRGLEEFFVVAETALRIFREAFLLLPEPMRLFAGDHVPKVNLLTISRLLTVAGLLTGLTGLTGLARLARLLTGGILAGVDHAEMLDDLFVFIGLGLQIGVFRLLFRRQRFSGGGDDVIQDHHRIGRIFVLRFKLGGVHKHFLDSQGAG